MSRSAKWLLAFLLAAAANAQTLAHKGWAGNGLTVEPWWQSALLYQIAPDNDLRGTAARLDYLQSLSVDALVLSAVPLNTAPTASQPFEPAYGTPEDLDQLVREATSRKIRILVDLPLGGSRTSAEVVNAARFWLSRGVAGLRLVPESNSPALTAAQLADRLRELQRLSASYSGERILFWAMPEPVPAATAPQRRGRRHARAADPNLAPGPTPLAPQLIWNPRLATPTPLNAPTLRRLLAAPTAPEPPVSVLYTDTSARQPEIDRELATVLLTTPGAAMLHSGQESRQQSRQEISTQSSAGTDPAAQDADPASLLNWYRRLALLRHTTQALRSGSLTLLSDPAPDVVAWVRTPPSGGVVSGPVLVMVSFSARPLTVSAAPALRRAGIPLGTGILRTLATPASDQGNGGAAAVGAISLPAYGVYLGELKAQPGLESSPAPLRRSRSHR